MSTNFTFTTDVYVWVSDSQSRQQETLVTRPSRTYSRCKFMQRIHSLLTCRTNFVHSLSLVRNTSLLGYIFSQLISTRIRARVWIAGCVSQWKIDRIMPERVKFLTYAVGIFLCYFYFGIIQEKITRGRYGDEVTEDGVGERFTFALALVWVQCFCNWIFAKGLLLRGMISWILTPTSVSFSSSASVEAAERRHHPYRLLCKLRSYLSIGDGQLQYGPTLGSVPYAGCRQVGETDPCDDTWRANRTQVVFVDQICLRSDHCGRRGAVYV